MSLQSSPCSSLRLESPVPQPHQGGKDPPGLELETQGTCPRSFPEAEERLPPSLPGRADHRHGRVVGSSSPFLDGGWIIFPGGHVSFSAWWSLRWAGVKSFLFMGLKPLGADLRRGRGLASHTALRGLAAVTRWDLGAAVGVGRVSFRGSGGGVAETAGLSVVSNSPSARLRGEQRVPAGLRVTACSGHRALSPVGWEGQEAGFRGPRAGQVGVSPGPQRGAPASPGSGAPPGAGVSSSLLNLAMKSTTLWAPEIG